ncbi:ZnMc domain-containing protein [Favolaschia claudopus]|uniref:ZnMc domain-containing protein n=1 Tax=Favolaschia claudopus TaxID=2862362 RepID=A0AAV9ZE79_9AGAR
MSFIAQWKTCGLAPSSALLQQSQNNSTTAATSASHAVVTRLDQLWDAGSTVTYSFLGGTANQQAKVDKVVLEWLPYANLNFPRVNQGGTIRIAFDASSGSWSWVGTLNRGIPSYDTTMNLGWINNDTNISADDRAVILHEFGHVLGLLHEHQSPARSGTLHLDENAVYAYYAMTQGWNKAMIKSQIIDVYDTNDVSNYSALDMKSIMMYFMPAAMDKERIEIKPNYVLSELDKAYMVINYPRAKPHPSAPEWTLAYAFEGGGGEWGGGEGYVGVGE